MIGRVLARMHGLSSLAFLFIGTGGMALMAGLMPARQ